MALATLPASTLVTRLKGDVMGNPVPSHVWRCRPSSHLEGADAMLSLRAVQKLCLVSETDIQGWERVPGVRAGSQ